MIRTVLIQIGLFLLPFGLYIGWLWVRDKNPFTGEHWTWWEVAMLTFTGLFLSVVLFGLGWQLSGNQISGRNEPVEQSVPR
jgi:hypothetical protein